MKVIASIVVFLAVLLSSHTAEATHGPASNVSLFPPLYADSHGTLGSHRVRIITAGTRLHHRTYGTTVAHGPSSNHTPDIGSVSIGANGMNLVGVMERQLGSNPTGWAHNWCSHYLGMVLREVGLPTSGSDSAISYAHYGHAANPAPGVIAVFRHHVGIVVKVLGNDKIELVSGNHSRRVGIGIYSTHKVVAWRSV